MKEFLTGVGLATAGLAVFSGSVVGILALQGRLNSSGVRDVPVLNQIVEKEPKTASGEGDVRPADASARKPSPQSSQSTGPEENEDTPRKGSRAMEAEPHTGDKRSSGDVFTLAPFEAPTDNEELARLHYATKKQRERIEKERAALEQERYEIALREQDLEERRRSVENLMRKVETAMQDLEAKRRQFEQDITILKESERKSIKAQAAKLDVMQPQVASELLLELGPEKEDLAVKLLVSMDVEAASKVLEQMDRARGARLIERATRVIQRK